MALGTDTPQYRALEKRDRERDTEREKGGNRDQHLFSFLVIQGWLGFNPGRSEGSVVPVPKPGSWAASLGQSSPEITANCQQGMWTS